MDVALRGIGVADVDDRASALGVVAGLATGFDDVDGLRTSDSGVAADGLASAAAADVLAIPSEIGLVAFGNSCVAAVLAMADSGIGALDDLEMAYAAGFADAFVVASVADVDSLARPFVVAGHLDIDAFVLPYAQFVRAHPFHRFSLQLSKRPF